MNLALHLEEGSKIKRKYGDGFIQAQHVDAHMGWAARPLSFGLRLTIKEAKYQLKGKGLVTSLLIWVTLLRWYPDLERL